MHTTYSPVMVFYLIMKVKKEKLLSQKNNLKLSRIDVGIEMSLFRNLNSKRDWGHAKDYVEVQWRMLQNKNRRLCYCYWKNETVRRFCELASTALGWGSAENGGLIWEGSNEVGIREETGEIVIRIDKDTMTN